MTVVDTLQCLMYNHVSDEQNGLLSSEGILLELLPKSIHYFGRPCKSTQKVKLSEIQKEALTYMMCSFMHEVSSCSIAGCIYFNPNH